MINRLFGKRLDKMYEPYNKEAKMAPVRYAELDAKTGNWVCLIKKGFPNHSCESETVGVSNMMIHLLSVHDIPLERQTFYGEAYLGESQ